MAAPCSDSDESDTSQSEELHEMPTEWLIFGGDDKV
jgi:hypothetical protein